ncbi:MAG: hypothetical protein ACHQO8_11895, partial [Vicinamibacterales bacterium]
MKRRLLLCLTIVAAFRAHPAAAVVVTEDVPVPGGAAAFAHALGIDPVPDRGRFLLEVTRLVYENPEIRNVSAATFLQVLRQPAARGRHADADASRPGALVPLPLTADRWGDAVFHRRVPRDEIVAAILSDRNASLLCHGLASLDDQTLEFFSDHPSLLARLYERSAPLFGAFAGHLHVRANRVVPPGDEGAAALWEAAVGEKVARAERFVLALYENGDGRLAYLYDTIGSLDPPRRAFALGASAPNPTARLERFKTLTTAGLGGIREWHARQLPFGRASYDLAMAFARIQVNTEGVPAPPASLALWSRVFGGGDAPEDAHIDGAWLAETVAATDVRQRADRIEQIAFAQRVFAAPDADRADVLFVLRALPRFRALALTVERMGITSPAVYAAAFRHAARVTSLEGRHGFVAEAQWQGAIALLSRMATVGTVDAAAAQRLLGRLAAAPMTDDGRYAGAIARWLADDLRPLLPEAPDMERAVLAALAGPSASGADASWRVTWEGQPYRLDLAGSERRRLQQVREKQGGVTLDVPVQVADATRLLAGKVSVGDLEELITQFSTLDDDLPRRSKEEEADQVPNGVPLPPSPHEILRKAIEELTRAVHAKDVKRAPRIAEPLVDLADDLLARTLLSVAYAIAVGDPDGAVMLADDVSQRHDFGFATRDADVRARIAWTLPRQEVSPNSPWHVTGSLLGLDLALAHLALRRVNSDHAIEAPKLTSNARDTFASSISLMNPFALRDADRDAIAGAIDRGTRRVAAATEAALETMAGEIAMDGARLRVFRWTHAHEQDRLTSMLSLTELLTLGGGRAADFHAWGMAVVATSGCLCSRVMPVGAWPVLAGRPQLGLAPSILPDLNFHIAIRLKELGLPAPLAKVVLSAAMQDFIDEVRPSDDGDWVTLSRAARTVSRERVEDYVAAATATGPLMPDTGRTPIEAGGA